MGIDRQGGGRVTGVSEEIPMSANPPMEVLTKSFGQYVLTSRITVCRDAAIGF